ncbi:MAG: glycoside hydrolase family 30 beta sandwich domain-containing protein [Lachnospiraceae bacterium]|nr:glycoside hydrolase family 30 beta sandwich domain-containing protein [Lachnospiraceae bacterium]
MNGSIIYTTYANKTRGEQEVSFTSHTDYEVERPLVNVYPQVTYQTFQGFGGTFTEAAAYCVKHAGGDNGDKIMADLFGADGLRYCCGRVHLDSCDASLSNYSAMDNPDDTALATFSLKRDEKYLIPMLKKAQSYSSRPLTLMVSPWSPPAFMKTNGEKNNGGKLKEEYFALWAKYICRFIREYENKGIHFSMLSLQNEPKAVQIWDSCIFTAAEEREYLRRYLVPELKAQGLGDIEILIWDHNKERVLERAMETIQDEEMQQIVSGVAMHWYSGDHFEQLAMFKKMFPDKRLVFSEGCVEYSRFSHDDHLGHARMYAHDIMGDLNNGTDCFIHWSLIFDQNGGPNHVNNLCEAIIMCDTEKKEYTKTLPYYYIAHFSRYIEPGAVRIGFSRFDDSLEVTAFQNPDGTRILVLLNESDREICFMLREGNEVAELKMLPDSIATVRYTV